VLPPACSQFCCGFLAVSAVMPETVASLHKAWKGCGRYVPIRLLLLPPPPPSLPPPCRGFRNSQPNGCGTPQGSCLRNQIYDLYFQDLARIDSGALLQLRASVPRATTAAALAAKQGHASAQLLHWQYQLDCSLCPRVTVGCKSSFLLQGGSRCTSWGGTAAAPTTCSRCCAVLMQGQGLCSYCISWLMQASCWQQR
jgi:hypothetical protein